MKDWNKREHFAALDWASDHHDVVVVNREGKLLENFAFAHRGLGWEELRQKLARYPGLAIAVETNQGAAVQQLVEAGLEVFIRSIPRARNATASARRPAESKTTRSTPGAWPTRCASMARGGGRCCQRIL
jgi:hypothetical protein